MPSLRGSRHVVRVSSVVAVAPESPLGVSYVEAGDVGTTTIEVQFTGGVVATDYKAGVTIRVNSISQTINTATRQDPDTTRVHFVIAAAADVDDVIDWAYDADSGDYEDDGGNPMGDVSAVTATNYIGSHTYFDTVDDAVWVGAL